MSSTHGGGSATQSGIDYQNRVAAWFAVGILVEQEATPPWELSADTTFKFLRCETEQPVDDLLIGTSQGGNVFIQIKHRVSLSRDIQSGFGKTIDQFVRQFLIYRNHPPGQRPWERELRDEYDRLVLITSPSSSSTIREDLPNLLAKIRRLSPAQSITDASAGSQKLQNSLESTLTLINNIWQNLTSELPNENEQRQILQLIRVQILDVDINGNDEQQAKDRLRASSLSDPTQSEVAWTSLINFCAQLAINQSGADQAIFQKHFLQSGISFKPSRKYQRDIELLTQYSQTTLDSLSELAEVRVGDEVVKIKRSVIQSLRAAAEQSSLLVTGEPGAGKSGTLYDFAKELQSDARDVVFLAVDRIEANSAGELREDLGLEHFLDEILRQWNSPHTGWLVIDALDAARSAQSVKTFRDLMAATIKIPNRWHVVVSIRKFDLRYSPELQRLFRGNVHVPKTFLDSEFQNIRHINVATLSDDELTAIRPQSRVLADFIDRADVKLKQLLAIPFNLRLMADLIGLAINPESLAPIQTQIELLDRFWQERVIRSDDLGDAREALLRKAVEKMVETRSLRIHRQELFEGKVSDTTSQLLKDILSSNTLSEWKSSSQVKVERSILTFTHHVLFDYAVSCLIFRGILDETLKRIEQEFDLVLAVRPSIVFLFQHLWFLERNRNSFWTLVLNVIQSDHIAEIGKLIGPSVAADLIQKANDYQPLFDALQGQSSQNEALCKTFSHLIGAVLVNSSKTTRPLAGPNSPPWCNLIEQCSHYLNLRLFYAVRPLLWDICKQPKILTPEQLQLAGTAARKFFEFAWGERLQQPEIWRLELESVCLTFESEISESSKLLQKLLEADSIKDFGYKSMFCIANQIQHIIPFDTELVFDIYTTAFSYRETSEATTQIGGSRIIPLSSNRKQDFQMVLYILNENFEQFLASDSIAATRALIIILGEYVNQKHKTTTSTEEKFLFDQQEASIKTDLSHIWDSSIYRNAYPLKILDKFADYFKNLGEAHNNSAECQKIINLLVSQAKTAILWRCLLRVGTAAPETRF